MLLYLLNVLDNTWLLALAAPLILASLRGDPDRRLVRRLMIGAAALGLVSAAALAALRLNTGWVIREFYDLGVLVPALAGVAAWLILALLPKEGSKAALAARLAVSASVAAMAWAVAWRLSGHRSAAVFAASAGIALIATSLGRGRLGRPRPALRGAAALGLAAMVARCAPSLMLYPFAFGVGLDSVFNLDYLAKVGGYLSGLAICGLLWLSLSMMSRRASWRLFRWFLALGALIVLVQLALECGQILAARRMVPRFWFRVVLFALERENWFFPIQAAVWSVLAAALMIRARAAVVVGANPALRRKMRASLRADFRSGVALILSMAMVLGAATTLRAVSRRGPVIAEPTPVEAPGGEIRLDIGPISDGNLHRMALQTDSGVPVRFIVIKKSQSAFGVGLDACDICGQSGYYQRGDQVICKLCDVVMNKSTIGFPGGCNPVPLDFALSGGSLVIRAEDLDREAHRFR